MGIKKYLNNLEMSSLKLGM